MHKVDSTAVRTARRLCAARVAAAERALAGRPTDEAIHLARRELKRARALLRLVRDGLAPVAFDAANAALRDVGGALGAARDAAVQRELVRETALAAGIEPAALRPLLARLDRERRARRAGIDAAGARALLAAARTRLVAARLEGDAAMLAAGFVLIYRRGRRGYAAAREVPRPARLHAWRKHVKHYWHALEALEPAWPRLMTAARGINRACRSPRGNCARANRPERSCATGARSSFTRKERLAGSAAGTICRTVPPMEDASASTVTSTFWPAWIRRRSASLTEASSR